MVSCGVAVMMVRELGQTNFALWLCCNPTYYEEKSKVLLSIRLLLASIRSYLQFQANVRTGLFSLNSGRINGDSVHMNDRPVHASDKG